MKAALLTCVSDDAVGRFCLNQLDRYGVDRTHVRPSAARPQLPGARETADNHANP
jgi:sugar/nucleoside kinase (ribokinase family)